MHERRTFVFHNPFGGDVDHNAGDPACPECWWDEAPRPCRRPGCAGLVHSEFGDEDTETGDWFLIHACDVCGDAYT